MSRLLNRTGLICYKAVICKISYLKLSSEMVIFGVDFVDMV